MLPAPREWLHAHVIDLTQSDRQSADADARDPIVEGRSAHGMLPAALISAVIGVQLPGAGSVYLGQPL